MLGEKRGEEVRGERRRGGESRRGGERGEEVRGIRAGQVCVQNTRKLSYNTQ